MISGDWGGSSFVEVNEKLFFHDTYISVCSELLIWFCKMNVVLKISTMARFLSCNNYIMLMILAFYNFLINIIFFTIANLSPL